MPKAVVTTRSGATVTVEGTETEVAAVLQLLDRRNEPLVLPALHARVGGKAKPKPTPTGLVVDLTNAKFFAQPRELSAVKAALEEQGHFYPVTTLSGLMLRLVREKRLRRIKKDGRWLYTE
jgi:hypothetical protein